MSKLLDQATGEWRDPIPVIFSHPTLPAHWVAEANDGKLYFFPATPGGWDKRTEYRGHSVALRRLDAETARKVLAVAGGGFDFAHMLDRDWILTD